MRKLSSSYSVSYEFRNKAGDELIKFKCAACYGTLYGYLNNNKIETTDYLILSNFLCEETKEYNTIYIKKIAKICDVKIKFLEENKIKVHGFKNPFYVRLFTTLFRKLFEIYGYGGGKDNVNNIKEFFKNYTKYATKCSYRDNLKRLLYFHNLNKIWNGGGHCIKYANKDLKIVGMTELKKYNPKNDYSVQSFFVLEK